MVAFNKNCHILAFSLVFCLFLHDATSITVGQVVIHKTFADYIRVRISFFFFSQKLRITFECGLNSSAGCFRVNTVIRLIHTYFVRELQARAFRLEASILVYLKCLEAFLFIGIHP